MKAKFLFLILTFLTTYSFGQTYSFSKLVKKATVETSSGNQERIIGTYQGPYRFVFETPNDPQIKNYSLCSIQDKTMLPAYLGMGY